MSDFGSFVDLLEAHRNNAQVLRSEFRMRNQALGLHVLKDDCGTRCDLASCERALVFGVATWSSPDMTALDHLINALKRIPLLVFDIDECRSEEDFQELMPGCSMPTQSPVVAYYFRGKLMDFVQGEDAVDWVATRKFDHPDHPAPE